MHANEFSLRQPLEVFLLQAIVFANGELELPANWKDLLGATDLILAADGGSQHLRSLGLKADALVGDLDSISAEDRAVLEQAGTELLSYPPEKDQTDLELALNEAKKRGAEQIYVLGGLGRRWDHSFANLMLTAQPGLRDLRITFLHGAQRLFLFRDELELAEEPGMRLSLIPVGGDVKGVRTAGLRYPLNREDLPFGSSRGVSNVVAEQQQRIELEEGLLLCVLSPGDLN